MDLEQPLRNHFLRYSKHGITPKFGLRREPKRKPHLDANSFTYLAYFQWVRDRNSFEDMFDPWNDGELVRFIPYNTSQARVD